MAVRRPAAAAVPAAGDVAPEILSKLVADLELSVRSRKALQRLNIMSVGELAARTEDELLGCKNFGQTSLHEIKQVLSTLGVGTAIYLAEYTRENWLTRVIRYGADCLATARAAAAAAPPEAL